MGDPVALDVLQVLFEHERFGHDQDHLCSVLSGKRENDLVVEGRERGYAPLHKAYNATIGTLEWNSGQPSSPNSSRSPTGRTYLHPNGE